MSIGLLLLIGAGILILLGLAQQVLDRLYLNDKWALLILAAMVGGSFIEIPLYRGQPPVSINLGGALIPLALSIYVLSRAGTAKETSRGILGAILVGALIYGVAKIYKFDINAGMIEPQYLWGIIAGVTAYIIGRSRRLAFISATSGVILADIAHAVEGAMRGTRYGPTRIGGAGVLDTVVLAGIIGLVLAEIIGETRERLQGGPDRSDERPEGLVEPEQQEGGADHE
ncbi:MAG TPA: DUF1614 domain-containing protein [Firmicutes bacterium]|uniref:DUF1614 domain-containing protein n=1 Tax=Capillibacterium thermochitinicola TaxID=2699427 RepID=A0A8J6HXV9_9FIRM|nr:DUF1614 domain-containing protein [Capillibacterium thermochitinicola]MBA2133512.1 DUF1614 domain-containing protein [Capillibacterium thermochitinicola]HHW13109.1 DUF1614 domain-containing protein [Bacillota bacterium]